MIIEGLTKAWKGSVELLLHRKGRARGRVHDGRGGVMVVVVHDDGRGRGGRRRRHDLFNILVFAPLADRVEPHAVPARTMLRRRRRADSSRRHLATAPRPHGHVSNSRFATQYQPVEACRGLAPGYISTWVEINQ